MSYDLGTARGYIELEYNGKGAVDKTERDMDRIGKKSKDTDKDLKRLSATLKGLFTGVKFAALGVAFTNAAVGAANLAVQVAGMVPQLVSIASLAAGLPATFIGLGAAIGTIGAITAGVGDTLKAAFDPKGAKKFEEGLKELSPAAQDFARAVQANVKPLKDYQQGIQEAFFSQTGLAQAVPKVVGLLNQVKPAIQGLTGEFARITRQVIALGTGSQTISFVRDSIVAFTDALNGASKALGPIFTGLRAVGGVGLPLLAQLGDAVGNLGVKFGDWLNQIANSGQLQSWIDTAISTLKTLGSIAQNIGSILLNVFKAAGETGGGLLETIAKVTGSFADFLKTTAGATAIRSLFQGIGAAASALSPVITTLVGALAGALGPALQRLATVLGPALVQVVEALAPALGPVANSIVDVVQALAPLLPPLAQFVAILARLAGGILSTLAAEFGPLIGLLAGGFSQVLRDLAPVLEEVLIKGLPLAAQAGQELLAAFAPLIPILVHFAQVFGQALIDNMPQLLAAVEKLIPIIGQFAALLAGQLGDALIRIIPMIPALVSAFITFVSVLVTIQGKLLAVYTFLAQLGDKIMSIPGAIAAGIGAMREAISTGIGAVLSFLGTAITNIVNFFTALPGRIGAALAALPGTVLGIIRNVASGAAFAFGAMIGTLVTLAVQTPGRIAGALAGLIGAVVGVVRAAWNAARSAFSAGINAAVSLANSLPGRARGAISALPGLLRSVAISAWNAVRSAFSSGINAAVSLARSLGGRIKSAVGNLAGLLAGAGRDAVQGFVNGIRSGIGAAADAARSLGSSVLSGIKSTLKIGSPSKEMIKIGRFTTQGLEKGLLGGAASIKTASNKLANYVLDAFNDKLISKKQRNTVLGILSSGTRQLNSLVNQANTVAGKLKTAQANLAAVQKSYNDTYASAVEKTKQTFALVTAGQSFVNLDLTKERFQDAVNQAKKFAADIQNLAKRGLSKDLLQQLVESGAADGGAMAAALANASDATLKEFNNLQGQLNSAANTVGKTTADALYGAGLKAAQGLVKGLQNQQAAIQRQMDKIADAMVARIKKALKIKSPSRIMFNLGKFTTQGLLDGMESLQRQVAQAAEKLATSSILPTVQLTASKASAQAQQNASVNTVAGNSLNIQQNVYALPGMSAEQVARFSLTKLRYGLSSGMVSASLPSPSPAGV